jgi:hypothetical protein
MRKIFQSIVSYFNLLPFDFKGLGFVLIVAATLMLLQFDRVNHQALISKKDLTLINGTLKSKPYVGNSKHGRFLNIYLNEYPEFRFLVDGWRFTEFHSEEFVNESDIGDTLTLGISNYDYATKIAGTKNLRFSDKVVDYSIIGPYSLSNRDVSFLNIEDTIKASQNSSKSTRRIWVNLLVIEASVVVLFILFKLFNRTTKIRNLFSSL